jgi:DNA polymerase-1
MEYRVMLDYAGEKDMIDAVNSGVDLHQATADLVGVTRKQAKTLNFAILYGSGAEKLGHMLGISMTEASNMRAKYFAKLPKVQQLVKNIIFSGQNRGFIWNKYGRRLGLNDYEMAYILPNHLIQGSCADIAKIGMNSVDELIRGTDTKLLANIHDELLLEVPESDLYLIPKIKEAMESVYIPKNGLGLTVGVDYSRKSWAYRDKQAWVGV